MQPKMKPEPRGLLPRQWAPRRAAGVARRPRRRPPADRARPAVLRDLPGIPTQSRRSKPQMSTTRRSRKFECITCTQCGELPQLAKLLRIDGKEHVNIVFIGHVDAGE